MVASPTDRRPHRLSSAPSASRCFAELEAALDAGGCTMFALEAPRGWGKTRVVHELYARLAARPGQEYWPLRLTEAPPDGSRTRHVIVPDAHPGDAPLPWLWWGVSCHLRPDGQPVQALAEALPQLEIHGHSLLEAAAARGTARASAKSLVLAVLGVVVPIVGLATTGASAAGDLWRGIRAAGAPRRGERPPDLVDVQQRQAADLVDRAVAALRAANVAGLPVVLVVDDAHHADATLTCLLKRILDGEEGVDRVLVVATTWPDEPGEFSRFAAGHAV